MRSATISKTGICSRRSKRAPRTLELPRIAAPALAVTSDASGRHDQACRMARRACGSRSEPTERVRSAAPPPASPQRAAAYPQTALTLNLAHARPHDDTSTEFHTESGPFTLVPLPGRRSSLVCVLDPAGATATFGHERRRAFRRDRAPRPFAARHDERRAGPRRLSARVRDRGCLRARTASRWSAKRPMSCRRSAPRGLISACATAPPSPRSSPMRGGENLDVGAPEVLARYDTQRRADVTSRTIAVDLLNRSLLTGFVPAHGARGLSLYLRRPHRAAAPCADARRRHARCRAAAADARRDGVRDANS